MKQAILTLKIGDENHGFHTFCKRFDAVSLDESIRWANAQSRNYLNVESAMMDYDDKIIRIK